MWCQLGIRDDVSTWRAEYDAVPTTPALARGDVARWGVSLADDARVDLVIAVNELVTNSVRHGPRGGRIRLAITQLADAVLFVEVSDDGPPGAAVPRAPDAVGGRGLHMVDFLSADWGSSADPTRTWFTLDTGVHAGELGVPADLGGSA
jgi:hypothetical protein